ncbi:MAG: hypothetical protein NTY83_03275 [Candidatus Micrarchaeota archaeon]|nr:hypothetical protein [Candidatus Micrarchaeota archaeon]
MESRGAVTVIREARIPVMGPVSEGRRRVDTPDFEGRLAVEQPPKPPSTQKEVRELQLVAVEIVATRMKAGLEAWKANDVDTALESARTVTGVWPRAEFFAMLSTELLFVATAEFNRFEGRASQKDAA